MINLQDINYFVAFNEYKTLSNTAENLHISQPTLTRAMQNLESELNVTLFNRTKNKMTLSDTGVYALKLFTNLLDNIDTDIQQVQQYDLNLNSITIQSCAPAPLWSLLPTLTNYLPSITITSSLTNNVYAYNALKSDKCNLSITSYKIGDNNLISIPYMKESLYIAVDYSHDLAKYNSVTFKQLNGFNFLLYKNIGFWYQLCVDLMPASKFLIQSDEYALSELIKNSTLPCFASDISIHNRDLQKRKIIPITDQQANVTYYLTFNKNNKLLKPLKDKFLLKE